MEREDRLEWKKEKDERDRMDYIEVERQKAGQYIARKEGMKEGKMGDGKGKRETIERGKERRTKSRQNKMKSERYEGKKAREIEGKIRKRHR